MEHLEFIRNAGETRRFHTWPVLRQQNVAEHSWHVTMLAHILYGQDEPGLTPAFIMACLTHDMAEWQVGDIPSPAKRNMDETLGSLLPHGTFRDYWGDMEQRLLAEQGMDWEKFLTDEEKRRLKFVDSLDGMMYCVRERAMGNKLIRPCYINFASYVKELLPSPIPCDEGVGAREWGAYQHAFDMWEQTNDS